MSFSQFHLLCGWMCTRSKWWVNWHFGHLSLSLCQNDLLHEIYFCVCVQCILGASIPSMGNKHGPIVIQKDNFTLRQRHSCQPLSSIVVPAKPTNVTTDRSCWPAYTQRNQNVITNKKTSYFTNQGTFKVKVISARQEKELSMDCNSFFKERKHLWQVQLFQQVSWTVWL